MEEERMSDQNDKEAIAKKEAAAIAARKEAADKKAGADGGQKK
ncbi:hypothetical protein GCM10009127_15620 [Alteraurantiacibacter aestuarii]